MLDIEYGKLQELFSVKISTHSYGMHEDAYNEGIFKCKKILMKYAESERGKHKGPAVDTEYKYLQELFDEALVKDPCTNKEGAFNTAILLCKSTLHNYAKNTKQHLKVEAAKMKKKDKILSDKIAEGARFTSLIELLFEFADCKSCPKRAYCKTRDEVIKLKTSKGIKALPATDPLVAQCHRELRKYLYADSVHQTNSKAAMKVSSWEEYCRYCLDNNCRIDYEQKVRLVKAADNGSLLAVVKDYESNDLQPLLRSVDWFVAHGISVVEFGGA